jgi:hypothetical protein
MKPDTSVSPSDRAPKLLAQVVDAIRIRHYSIKTEEAYVHWVKAYIRFHGLRHRWDMARRGVAARCGAGFCRLKALYRLPIR